MKSDVIMVIGANPTDGHPVFASQMKRRLREGAKLIVVDPRTHRPGAHAARRGATTTCSCGRAPTSRSINALAHVVVTEGLRRRRLRRGALRHAGVRRSGARSSLEPRNSPEAMEAITGVPAAQVRGAARLYATGGNGAIYYGLGVTEHSQGSTMVMGIANLAMATGNIGREGVGVNPLRGQNNVQGSCDMGSFPHELPGYRHVSDAARARAVRARSGASSCEPEPGLRIPNMFDAALDGQFKGLYVQGEDIAQSDPEHAARDRGAVGDGVHGRAGPLPERDREVRARVPAGLVVPREGRHVHQRRAPHLAGAQGHAAARRAGGLGSHAALVECAGLPDELHASVARSWTRSRA